MEIAVVGGSVTIPVGTWIVVVEGNSWVTTLVAVVDVETAIDVVVANPLVSAPRVALPNTDASLAEAVSLVEACRLAASRSGDVMFKLVAELEFEGEGENGDSLVIWLVS